MIFRRHFALICALLLFLLSICGAEGAVSYLLVQGPFGGGAVVTYKWQVEYDPGQLLSGQDLLNVIFGTPAVTGTYGISGPPYLTSSSGSMGAGYINFGTVSVPSLFVESFTVGGKTVAQPNDYSKTWSYYEGIIYPDGNSLWLYANTGPQGRLLADGSFDGFVFGADSGDPNYTPPSITGVENIPKASNFPAATWAANNGLSPGNSLPGADPDGDGKINLLEFATDDNPNSPSASGRMVTKFWMIGGQHVFTLTMPVRNGAIFSGAGDQVSAAIDGVIYEIQGTDDLVAGFTGSVAVSEVTGTDATNIQAGLPMLDSGWTYRTFRKSASAVSSPASFLRLKVTSAP
ncbi:MAG: hypothetical protein WCN98_08520 [Verrucomicrobiaceae bacterium]